MLTVELPILVQLNESIIDKIDFFFDRNEIKVDNALVVCGNTISHKYGEIVSKNINSDYYIIKDNKYSSIDTLVKYCQENKISMLIGVGGGKVLDSVKRASLLLGIRNFLIPTIISNDGLFSPIAVLKNQENKSVSLSGQMPSGVLVDLGVIKDAPKEYIIAAAGDILSNISATNDWILANQWKKEKINDIAYLLSRSSANSLIYHESKNINDDSFIKQVIYSQLNSGLAMSLSGNTRPCSGSEHLISHAIDYLGLNNNLHGLQVGSISYFSLFLQRKIDIKCLNYAYNLGIPLGFHNLNKDILDNIDEIFKFSFKMRPDRFTVLDLYNTNENLLKKEYYLYLEFMEKMKI